MVRNNCTCALLLHLHLTEANDAPPPERACGIYYIILYYIILYYISLYYIILYYIITGCMRPFLFRGGASPLPSALPLHTQTRSRSSIVDHIHYIRYHGNFFSLKLHDIRAVQDYRIFLFFYRLCYQWNNIDIVIVCACAHVCAWRVRVVYVYIGVCARVRARVCCVCIVCVCVRVCVCVCVAP
jgi:hypothetical protein